MRVFVYGTLRRDFPLHDYIEEALGLPPGSGLAHPVKCRTLGRLHYHRCGAFPVLLPDLAGLTVGEVYDLPMNKTTESMIWMEIGAGYELVERHVVTDKSRCFKAWQFVWPDWLRDFVGAQVPENDWATVGRTIFDKAVRG